jgi:hypothetical protein
MLKTLLINVVAILMLSLSTFAVAQSNCYYPDSGAADHDITGNNNTIKYCVDLIGTTKATLCLSHDTGNSTTTYTLNTSVTIPDNITIVMERGSVLSIASGKTLTISNPGNVDVTSNQHIFTGGGTVDFENAGIAYLAWWGAIPNDDSVNDSSALQSCLDASVQADGVTSCRRTVSHLE